MVLEVGWLLVIVVVGCSGWSSSRGRAEHGGTAMSGSSSNHYRSTKRRRERVGSTRFVKVAQPVKIKNCTAQKKKGHKHMPVESHPQRPKSEASKPCPVLPTSIPKKTSRDGMHTRNPKLHPCNPYPISRPHKQPSPKSDDPRHWQATHREPAQYGTVCAYLKMRSSNKQGAPDHTQKHNSLYDMNS